MEKQAYGKVAAGVTKLSVPRSVTSLSPGAIETLPAHELRRILPQLVAILHEREARRPEWWPGVLPWTQHRLVSAVKSAAPSAMRKVAKKCCNFLTQCSSKAVPTTVPVFMQPRVLDWVNSHPPSRSCTQSVKSGVNANPRKSDTGGVPYQDIYLCYRCNEEFCTKDTLQKHQVQCIGGALPLSMSSTPPVSEAPSPAPPTSTSEDSSSLGVISAATSPSSKSSLCQSQFVSALDLVPIHKARKIRQARRRNTECETIDLEEPQTPVSPSTPRSHKILITQLSRDASSSSLGGSGNSGGIGSRRSSCLRLSLDKKPDNVGTDKEEEQRSESDGESSESNAEDADERKLRKKTLFSIDVSSLLGQRIIKHMTSEVHVPVISNLEDYCRTPIKDKYQDRLRIRQTTYPVTWKLTRKRQQQFWHMYKFTSADKLDFKETMRTGLNQQSRKLRDSLKRCSVVVKRLSRKTLLKSLTKQLLTQAKKGLSQPSVFPEGPTFLLTDVDRVLGLKRKDGKPELARKLLASHCVSETANAELQSQKLTVYRCLLTDLYRSVTSDGGRHSGKAAAGGRYREGSRKTRQKYPALLSILSGAVSEYQHPLENKTAGAASAELEKPLKIDIPSPSTGLLLPGKKSGSLDDSFSVKTLSSDEDSDKNILCCSLCTVRSKCRCLLKESESSVVDAAACSPALSSKLSTMSKASTSPPQLDPPCLTPKVSVSSHPSLSPPNLSPVSQVSELNTCSPSSAHRLCTRKSALLLKTSSFPCMLPSSRPESTGDLSGKSCSHCPPAPLPCQIVGCKGDDMIPVEQAHSSPLSPKRAQSSPVLSSPSIQVQPQIVSHSQRPQTRSSSKQKVTVESSDSVSQQKSIHCGLDCSCQSTECLSRPSSAVMGSAEELSKEFESSRFTSPVAHSVSKHNLESCPTVKSDMVVSKGEGKEVCLKIGPETSERVVKNSAKDKVQTRSSLNESSEGQSGKTEQRKDTTDSKKLRNGKWCGAGGIATKLSQKVELRKKTWAEENMLKEEGEETVDETNVACNCEKEVMATTVSKVLRNCEKEVMATTVSKVLRSSEKEVMATTVSKVLRSSEKEVMATTVSKVLRSSESIHGEEEVSKETPSKGNTHAGITQEMRVTGSKVIDCSREVREKVAKKSTYKREVIDAAANEESTGVRTLRSRETKDALTRKQEMTVSGQVTKTVSGQVTKTVSGQVTKIEHNTRKKNIGNRKVNTEIGKLKTETSEPVKKHQDEDTTKCKEEESRQLPGAREVGKKRVKDCSEVRKTSDNTGKEGSIKMKNPGEAQDVKESVTVKEVENFDTEGLDRSVTSYGDSHQSGMGEKTADSDIARSSLLQDDASGKEKGTNAIQTQTVLLRRTSSRKGTAAAQIDIPVEDDSIKRHSGRFTRRTAVKNGTETFSTEKSEEKAVNSISTLEPRKLKRKHLVSQKHGAQKSSPDPNASHVNPFLVSRAQTGVFSSRIKECTRQTRTLALKLPTARGKAKNRDLRSGNTFRMGTVSLGAPTNGSSVISNTSDGKPLSDSCGLVGPVSPTRVHLSPKQMLSVLESVKGSSSLSKDKSRKKSASPDTTSHGSSLRHAVHAVNSTKGTVSHGSSVRTADQGTPVGGTTTPRHVAKRTSIQTIPAKSQGSLAGMAANARILFKNGSGIRPQAKNSSSSSNGASSKTVSSVKKSGISVTRVIGKRLTSSTVIAESGSPRKKMCA